jgi:uncharacterized protein YggU (UPF0235/DUF167 family)
MRIIVVAHAGSKRAFVKKIEHNRYSIHVTEPPEHGKANYAIRKALAAELALAPSRLSLVLGVTSKIKLFEVQ